MTPETTALIVQEEREAVGGGMSSELAELANTKSAMELELRGLEENMKQA